jgi:hypothetical protein
MGEVSSGGKKVYSDEWKGIMRMVKHCPNHHGRPVKPSFLLEVMALEEQWMEANAKLIREMGAETYVATLLSVLRTDS